MCYFKMGLIPTRPATYCRRTSIFVLLVFIQLGLWAQDTDLLTREQARFQAQIEQNTVALSDLLHDDLYYLHSNGLAESKTDFIHSVSSAKIVYQRMIPQNQQIRRYKRTAILTGLLQVSGLYEGNPFDIELYYTSIYLKKKGRWLLVSWQSTGKK